MQVNDLLLQQPSLRDHKIAVKVRAVDRSLSQKDVNYQLHVDVGDVRLLHSNGLNAALVLYSFYFICLFRNYCGPGLTPQQVWHVHYKNI